MRWGAIGGAAAASGSSLLYAFLPTVLSASASMSRMISIDSLMRGGSFHSSMIVNRSPSIMFVLRPREAADQSLSHCGPVWCLGGRGCSALTTSDSRHGHATE